MGTRAVVRVDPDRGDLLDLAERRLRDLERRWSRFLPDSEISRLNAGEPVELSAPTRQLLDLAITAKELTGGLFDTRVGAALVAAGYDRSFEGLEADRGPLVEGPEPAAAGPDGGTLVDPGGIGKGLAADLVASELVGEGATSVAVDLGGDMRLCGSNPRSSCWTVLVEDPHDLDATIAEIHLRDGAVATSSRARRRWSHDGIAQHHLIDPRTGRPARSGLASVTVVATEAWWADVLAKAAFVAGLDEGRPLVASYGCSALFVTMAGEHVRVGDHFREVACV